MTHKKTGVAKKLKSLPDLLGAINAYYDCSTGLDISAVKATVHCAFTSGYGLVVDLGDRLEVPVSKSSHQHSEMVLMAGLIYSNKYLAFAFCVD